MFAVTLMIISAVVGAGFATGAELVAFFGDSTLPPIVIALIVGIFLFCIMTALMYLPRSLNKKLFAPVLFIFFVAMTAGITELVGPAAAAVAVVISIFIVWFGFERMLNANKILVLIALSILLIAVVWNFGGAMPKSNLPSNSFATIGNALLYAGMNCCCLPAIFAEARRTFSRKALLISILTASVTISFFALLILTAVRVNNVGDAAMPVLAFSNSPVVVLAVFICILTSMFTTLFSLQSSKTAPPNKNTPQNQKNMPSHGSSGIVFLCGIGVLGYALSFLGFTKVIGIFYPIVGVLMLGFVIFLSCLCLKDYFACRRIRAR